MTAETVLLGVGILLLVGLLFFFALSMVRQLRRGASAPRREVHHRPTLRSSLVFELLFVGLVVALLVVGIIEFVGRLG